MCFVLYVGTTKPLPRTAFAPGSLDLAVAALTEHDAIVKRHFKSPEVQLVGSTSGCGCDFPHLTFQGDGWPYFEAPSLDSEEAAGERLNCEKLVGLLKSTGDSYVEYVELYGIWEGDFVDDPHAREDIILDAILEPGFRFKERGFYRVAVSQH